MSWFLRVYGALLVRFGIASADAGAFLRFLASGVTTVLVKLSTYVFLSRVLWAAGPRTVENAIAIVVSTVCNYALHRYWTFAHQKPHAGSVGRYAIVWATASALETGMFWLGHRVLGVHDLVMVIFNSGAIALMTFVIHRVFTFRERPASKTA